jgi:ParB family chromosome partitioning protein
MANEQVRMKLSKLKNHARQDAVFGDVPDAELAALAADMAKNGLQHPVEVLPDDTIIAGHQRVRAARSLGWKEIDVVVRHDLAEAGEDAVEAYLISDNLLRRQMSPLARARCIERCMELGVIPGAAFRGFVRRHELKAVVGKLMGLSPRSVNRYLLVLRTPLAVQLAFDRGEIKLADAGKIAGLDPADAADLAARLEAGEPAAAVVAEVLSGGRRPAEPKTAFRKMLGDLRRKLPVIKAGADQISLPKGSVAAATLRAAVTLFGGILKKAK